jgi:hypothetical protein
MVRSVRTSLSKTLRFEVFKRDSFTCQYCGRKAPDVLLEADHIEPVAKGGSDDFLNLVTACKDCNSGKSDKRLSDTAVLDKQRAQLEELQARREQIDMMFQWQNALLELQDDVLNRLHAVWSEHAYGFALNDIGIKGLKKLQKKYSIDEIIEGIRAVSDKHIEIKDGQPTRESIELAWEKLPGMCSIKKLEKENPTLLRLKYIRGILRNRLAYCNEEMAMNLLQEAIQLNANLDSLESFSKSVKNWTQWTDGIIEYINNQLSKEHPTGSAE